MNEYKHKDTITKINEYMKENYRPMYWYEKLYKYLTWKVFKFLYR